MRKPLLALLLATLSLPAMAAIFCCKDDKGKQVCGDPLPAECGKKVYKEIDSRGLAKKQVDLPPTAEELKRIEAEKEMQKEEARRLAEQRRRDKALMDSYGSEKDIDAARDLAKRDVQQAIATARTKIADAEKTRKKLEAEAEFYKKTTVPASIRNGLKENEAEVKAQQGLIETKQAELDTIDMRFEQEKQRFRELNRKQAPSHPAAVAPR